MPACYFGCSDCVHQSTAISLCVAMVTSGMMRGQTSMCGQMRSRRVVGLTPCSVYAALRCGGTLQALDCVEDSVHVYRIMILPFRFVFVILSLL